LTVRLDADGELQVSGGSGFGGYFRDAEATRAVTTADGYYRTGDAIRLTGEGELQFLDRVKDLRRLSTGEAYPPQFIENQLRASPYIRDAIVLGDESRAFVTALINVDAEIVGRYAETRGLAWGTFADLSQLPDVHDLMRATLTRINAGLDGVAGVTRFATLPKELDPDDAELTRSRKLRRNVIEERYAPIIAALYDEADRCTLRIEVQYRDGSTAHIDAQVRVTDVGERL
jgi:long-chain acyl-CoA synthetase